MLQQCCNHSKLCRNNVETLCCAKNRRYESSRVTSLWFSCFSSNENDLLYFLSLTLALSLSSRSMWAFKFSRKKTRPCCCLFFLLGCVQTDATLLTNNSQHCWMLHVASVCTPCCMLLDVVACCCAKFETGQTFQPTTPNISFVPWSPKRSATMLDPFAQLFQHCWGHARSLRMDYKDLWVVFFPRCTAGPKLVGSCCIRLHTTANTDATTTKIVGATMLGVVAFVFLQPYHGVPRCTHFARASAPLSRLFCYSKLVKNFFQDYYCDRI